MGVNNSSIKSASVFPEAIQFSEHERRERIIIALEKIKMTKNISELEKNLLLLNNIYFDIENRISKTNYRE
jgi:hypothetical protein